MGTTMTGRITIEYVTMVFNKWSERLVDCARVSLTTTKITIEPAATTMSEDATTMSEDATTKVEDADDQDDSDCEPYPGSGWVPLAPAYPQAYYLPYLPPPVYMMRPLFQYTTTPFYPTAGTHYFFSTGPMQNPVLSPPANPMTTTHPTDGDVSNEWLIPRKKTLGKAPEGNTKRLTIKDIRLYKILLGYIPSKKVLENLGYPMGSPPEATVYKQSSRPVPRKKHKYEMTCSRCANTFNADPSNYSEESCCYHPGKFVVDKHYSIPMTCCKKQTPTPGCTKGRMHVWFGWDYGLNNYTGFARTVRGSSGPQVYALDCEMGFTKVGMEVIRVTMVGLGGGVVYDTLVTPRNELIDYNTEYSGISDKDFRDGQAKSFYEARQELLTMIQSDTILIGHGLENDLRVLNILHFYVIDTAIIFPHLSGMPCRRSLRSLAKDILGVKIQQGSGTTGHDSSEDARICVQLVLRKLKDDHNVVLKS